MTKKKCFKGDQALQLAFWSASVLDDMTSFDGTQFCATIFIFLTLWKQIPSLYLPNHTFSMLSLLFNPQDHMLCSLTFLMVSFTWMRHFTIILFHITFKSSVEITRAWFNVAYCNLPCTLFFSCEKWKAECMVWYDTGVRSTHRASRVYFQCWSPSSGYPETTMFRAPKVQTVGKRNIQYRKIITINIVTLRNVLFSFFFLSTSYQDGTKLAIVST